MSLSVILPIYKFEETHLSLLNYYLDITDNFDVEFLLIVIIILIILIYLLIMKELNYLLKDWLALYVQLCLI